MPFLPTLVPTHPSHLMAIAVLEQCCFEASAWTTEQIDGELTRLGHMGFVLRHGAKPVGYILGWVIEDECELLRIAMNPSKRGQRLSHLMMTQFLSTASKQGASKCFLEVRNTNNAAIGLYKHHGFQQTGLRANYYADGADALLMRADLPSVTKSQTH